MFKLFKILLSKLMKPPLDILPLFSDGKTAFADSLVYINDFLEREFFILCYSLLYKRDYTFILTEKEQMLIDYNLDFLRFVTRYFMTNHTQYNTYVSLYTNFITRFTMNVKTHMSPQLKRIFYRHFSFHTVDSKRKFEMAKGKVADKDFEPALEEYILQYFEFKMLEFNDFLLKVKIQFEEEENGGSIINLETEDTKSSDFGLTRDFSKMVTNKFFLQKILRLTVLSNFSNKPLGDIEI